MILLLTTPSSGEDQTTEIASKMTHDLFRPGIPVLLSGQLGAGKTCFVKGIARHLGIPDPLVASPTFALINEYRGSVFILNHMDFYRLDSWEEAVDLGLDEYLIQGSFTVIEWGEKFISSFPPPYFVVKLTEIGDRDRRIEVYYQEYDHDE